MAELNINDPENIAPQPDTQLVVERVMRIARRIAARQVLDPRTPDEIIGYNNIGVPE
jgi:hypothetical protein